MSNLKRYADWWFKELHVRRGGYVITEPINPPLIVFTVSIILALISYKGFWQIAFSIVAYAALVYWAILEIHSGRSRFRKALGVTALLTVAGALALGLGV